MEDRATSINDYEITETALQSVEGMIYRAIEKSSGTQVLLKKYYPSLDWSEEVLNEFFNLFSYLRFIEHEYLLTILDLGKDNGKPYVVFADPSLTLLRDGTIEGTSQKQILNFLSNVAEALDFLHKQEIIHGGVSIENVALDPHGYPLLFDFGLSRVFKKLLLENMNDGFENISVGNPKCTSPEQILGRSPTRASDIYAFGIIGYYYSFGELPFNGQSVAEIALSHLTPGVIRSVELPEGISEGILAILQKCIQVNPEARFESFSQILSNLDKLKPGKRVFMRFDRRFTISNPVSHARRWIPLTGAAALTVLLFFFSYLYLRDATAATQTSPVAATAAARLPTATKTEEPGLETPTKSATSPPRTPALPTEVRVEFRLAFEAETPVSLDQFISLENLSDLREISRLGYGRPEAADLAPDDRHVAIATSAGVVLFDGDQFLKWLDPQGWATSVQFSPRGEILAIGLKSGEIQLWDWQGGSKSSTLTGHTQEINRILFSEGGLLYSASADQHIITWELESNKSIKDIVAHSKAVNDIAVTSDARILVSCSDDRLIRVWDLASAQKLYELDSKYFTGIIKAIAISSDDAYLAAGGESGYLYQWNLITTPLTLEVPRPRTDIVPVKERIWSLQYSPDNKQLLVGVDNGKTITYDAEKQSYGGLSSPFKLRQPSLKLVDVFGASFDFDSSSVLGQENVVSINWDGQVTFREAQLVSPMYDILDRLDFSPDGRILAAGGKRGSTHVWDLTTNQALYKNLYFLPFGDPIAPDGSSVALIVPRSIRTSSGNELIEEIYQIKELSGSQETRDLSQVIPDANVGYSSDGTMLIAASLENSRAWEYTNGNEAEISGHTYSGCRITTSGNDSQDHLQVNSPAGIFPLLDDEHVDSLCPKTHQFRRTLTAFSNDLNLMVYMDSNGSLAGYDVLRQSSAWQPYHIPATTKVTTLAVSPNGSLIALGDESGHIQFVNGTSGEFIGEIVGNFGIVHAVEFSEDGKKLATAGQDGVVRVFGVVEFP